MANNSQQVVQKLWQYCNILRDDGLAFPAYIEQLTYLLFLKMAYEQAELSPKKISIIPEEYNWRSLISKNGKDSRDLHTYYGTILKTLSNGDGMLGVIFYEAKNKIRDPAKLKLLIDLIGKDNWSGLDTDIKGDAYEGLLEKGAQDNKTGAGQYFTPRPLIQAIIECLRPQLGETIYDPACGTCGFLLAAHDFIIRQNPRMSPKQKQHLRLKAFKGVEIAGEIARLGAMNLQLHGIGPVIYEEGTLPIITDDSLTTHPGELYDVIPTNPPFGKKSSVTMISELRDEEKQALSILRPDFIISTSNKQLNFLQHIYTTLKINGRAGVVVPDNVLFEGGAGEVIRRRLLHDCEVHTLLRLPPGIFYAHGIKTNVLFFDQKPKTEEAATKKLWIYDLRTNMHFTLRTKRLEQSDLKEFVACYKAGDREARKATWSPQRNPTGRWRDYPYHELVKRDKCNLDIFWLKEDMEDDFSSEIDTRDIASEILDDLQAAMFQISEIVADLNENE